MIVSENASLDEPENAESLAGRVAIVTGAGSRGGAIGNGSAASIRLARRGAFVALVDSSQDAALSTARIIERKGGKCSIHVADVSDEQSCIELAKAAREKWGSVDILVNNVGVRGPQGTAKDVSSFDWDRVMQINVKSMMLMAKACLAGMIDRQRGAIINISSTAALRGGHPDLAYPCSKGAIISLTRAMAAHHGAAGIRVNCVIPGPVYTPMAVDEGVDDRVRQKRIRSVPLMREGTGWDVGMAVAWLASDEARWITGALIPVDGGMTASRVPPPRSS
jgi:NAD(P)-dependent dehydrogenase (short-subunit alcohol dehydrogenase family)